MMGNQMDDESTLSTSGRSFEFQLIQPPTARSCQQSVLELEIVNSDVQRSKKKFELIVIWELVPAFAKDMVYEDSITQNGGFYEICQL